MRGLLCMLFITATIAQSINLTPDQVTALVNHLSKNSDFLAALQVLIATNSVKTNPCTQTLNNVCVSCSSDYVLNNGICTLITQTSSTLPPSLVLPPTQSVPSASIASSTTSLPGLVTGGSATSGNPNAQSNQNGAFSPFYFITTPVTMDNQYQDSYTDNKCKTIN